MSSNNEEDPKKGIKRKVAKVTAALALLGLFVPAVDPVLLTKAKVLLDIASSVFGWGS